MLVSYNNKISGSFMFSPEAAGLIADYGRLDREFAAEAWLCGKTTMEEFTGGKQPDIVDNKKLPHEDFVAQKNAEQYVVVTDAKGEIGYEKPYLERGGQKSYIIELLTEKAGASYLAYLRKLGISYIFAGEEELDLQLAMRKLKYLFGIKLLISHGGGYTNGALLRAGLIDELSLVKVPLIEEGRNAVSLFGEGEIPQLQFELVNAQKLKNGGEWLRYLIK